MLVPAARQHSAPVRDPALRAPGRSPLFAAPAHAAAISGDAAACWQRVPVEKKKKESSGGITECSSAPNSTRPPNRLHTRKLRAMSPQMVTGAHI
eukprot:4941720-Prymnesium_polylepis.2